MRAEKLGSHLFHFERSSHLKEKNLLYEKIYGCLMGVGIGDAMGMPTEFLSLTQVREHFGEVRAFEPAPPWHPLAHLPAGNMTDDTEQTLSIAKMVIEKPDFGVHDVADAILQWAEEITADDLDKMGPSTNYALKRLRAGHDPHGTGLRGNTNGAAMRIAPIGCIHPGRPQDVIKDVLKTCIPTHLTDVAVAGASAVAAGVSEALGADADLDSIIEAMLWGAKEGEEQAREAIRISTKGRIPWEVISSQVNPSLVERMKWAIELAEKTEGTLAQRRDVLARSIGTGVLMIETIPLAVGIFKMAKGDPYTAIMLATNAGGDADSISSIVGGICGAFKGASSFAEDLVCQFEQVNDVSLRDFARGLTDRAAKKE